MCKILQGAYDRCKSSLPLELLQILFDAVDTFTICGGDFCDQTVCGSALLTWFDESSSESDWLLPHYSGGQLTAAMIIDSYTGDIHQVLWGDPGDIPTLQALTDQITAEYSGIFPQGQFNVPESAAFVLMLLAFAASALSRRKTR